MPDTETEMPSRNWGGRRPGAGAPRGNRNAVRRPPRDPDDAELEALVREAPFDALLRFFPPAVRELLRLALRNATAGALAAAEALPPLPDPAETGARRIELYLAATNLVMTMAADAWNMRLQRDPREAALIRALKPWLVIENPELPGPPHNWVAVSGDERNTSVWRATLPAHGRWVDATSTADGGGAGRGLEAVPGGSFAALD